MREGNTAGGERDAGLPRIESPDEAGAAGPSIDLNALAIRTMEQGVLVHDGTTVLACNDRVAALLGYPPELIAPGVPMSRFIEHGARRGDYDASTLALETMRAKLAAGEEYVTERRAGQRMLRIDSRVREGLTVVTYTDVSEARRAERAAERERERTEEASRRLHGAIEALGDAFGLYDAEERLVLANHAYRSLDPRVAGVMVPGTPYEAIVRRAAAVGFWPEDGATGGHGGGHGGEHGGGHGGECPEDGWVAERLRVFREGAEDRVYRAADGRWFLSRDRQLPGGERVCIRVDVSDVKRKEQALASSREQVRFLAERDGLTGLTNRRAFDEALVDRLRNGRALLALVLVDLDRFKPVNDTHGHAAGDALLKTLASRFTAAARDADVVARIGGDEFAVLAEVPDEAAGRALADRLRAVASEPVRIDGAVLEVGACAGVAFAGGRPPAVSDRLASDQLMKAADLALYAAKAAGRGRTEAFEPRMETRARAKQALEADLRGALAAGQMELHYQVQRDLRANAVVGYEALMRWRHPERGLIGPSDFIPIAEQTGLIVPLGAWALRRATRDLVALGATTRVSVNVSPVQFVQGDLVADVRAALRESNLDPARLEIEMTEKVLVEDTEATLRTLEGLRALGVGLSLDDFGSGYSSLAYLTRFPFSKIKIDRCFVDRMLDDDRSGAVVRSILALASSLDLKVTAEGVETHGQLMSLVRGRCDEAQGYLLGRPVPIDEIDAEADGSGARESSA